MPRQLTDCNCSICRRYGALWAYYRRRAVQVIAARGALERYAWLNRRLQFCRCATCGCLTHYQRARPTPDSTVGVNGRLLDPTLVATLRIRKLGFRRDRVKPWACCGARRRCPVGRPSFCPPPPEFCGNFPVLPGPSAPEVSGRSAAGSAPVLGAGCRRFESCRPDSRKFR